MIIGFGSNSCQDGIFGKDKEQANANGFFTGGRAPYGYTTNKIPDPAGKRGKGGGIAMRTVLVIDDIKARAVKDIFLWSSQGIGLLSIADRLNQAGVPVPDRAKGFSTSTIRSILHNETYLGRLIYNKQRFFKKPDGKHCKRDNPRTDWHIKKMPDLRIIEDDVWQTVHERFAKRKKNGATTNARTNCYALSGLISCSCGAKFTAHKTMRKGHQYVTYRCGANRRSGSSVCASEVKIKQEQLMEAVCSAFDKKILNPECEAKIIAYVEKMITESKGDYGARKEVMESEIKTLTKEIEKLVKIASITDGDLNELAKDMNAKSKRREVVREALAGLETLVQDTLLDDLPAKVRAELSSVRLVLEGADPQALHAELQKHIDTINVDLEGLITIKGSLSGALKSVLKLVAGARNSLKHRWMGWEYSVSRHAIKSATVAELVG